MKTIFALGVLLAAGAGAAVAQEPAARPDTAKAAAKWDSAAAHNEHAAGQQAVALDLNTATKGQLEAAGLGPYADKIMEGRPFKSAQELVDKNILPPEALNSLKGKVKLGPS